MSFGITVVDDGTLQKVDDRLKQLEDLDVTALLEGIGAEVESQTRRRISEEKRAPDGSAWPEWSVGYAGKKHGDKASHLPHPDDLREFGGHSLLQLEGNLLDSIQSEVQGYEVRVGSNMVYAATHQFGRGAIPAREFLGLSDENHTDIERLVADFLDEVLR